MSVALRRGGNYVVYTGRAQSASNAFASIISYLEIAYYWNNGTGLHEPVITTTMMVPHGAYWVEVTQNCTWTYGAEATAPSSVQLHGEWNTVPYLGPEQSVESAFASISTYLYPAPSVWGYYFNNTTKAWENLPSTMIPNGVYTVLVTQNCVWTFVEPEIVPCEILIDAPNSAEEGELVYVSATIRNVSPYNYSYKTEIYAGANLILGTDDIITSGSSRIYAIPFTMPGRNITVLVWVERWSFDHWAYDNSAHKEVAVFVAPPPPEYAGILTRKELDYDAVRVPFPVQ